MEQKHQAGSAAQVYQVRKSADETESQDLIISQAGESLGGLTTDDRVSTAVELAG